MVEVVENPKRRSFSKEMPSEKQIERDLRNALNSGPLPGHFVESGSWAGADAGQPVVVAGWPETVANKT